MTDRDATDLAPPGLIDASGYGEQTSNSRAPIVGLVAILIAFVAIGSLFALQQPPFIGADEKAHLAYAYVVADGGLPTIDQRQPVPMWAEQWLQETIYTQLDRNRTIWVANHPPLYYATVAPLVWIAEATERPDGGLLLLRLANVAFGAVGVALTYAIAKELTRSSRLALLSAGVAAMMTQLHASLSLAMSDGMTFAAGAAVTLAGLRCLQRGTTNRNLAFLSAATVVATGARAVTMLVAFAVVAFVGLCELRNRQSPMADRRRAALRVGVIGVGPAIVAFGWFYVRNIVLYGDIGASSYLLERFEREVNGSILSSLLNGALWRSLFFRSMSPVTFRGPHPPLMLLISAIAIVGLVAVYVSRRTGDRGPTQQQYPVARRSVLMMLLGLAVIVVYIAQHVSGGGYLHARYAFPIVASVATLLVVGLDRVWPRVLPLLTLVGMSVWTLSQIPVSVDPSLSSRPRDRQLAPAALRTLPGADYWRGFAGFWIVVGCTVAACALLVVVAVPEWRDRQAARQAEIGRRSDLGGSTIEPHTAAVIAQRNATAHRPQL